MACSEKGSCCCTARTETRSWHQVDSGVSWPFLSWLCWSLFRSSVQKMKVNGLDGFLRPVKKEEARRAPPDQLLKEWRFTAPPALAITHAVATFILLDGHPASIVEGEGFQQLLKLTEPRYVSVQAEPTFSMYVRTYAMACNLEMCVMLFQTYIPALYHKVKLLQKQALHDPFPSLDHSNQSMSSILSCPNPHHPVSFTTDMWTGPDHESYICLTAHWLAPDWQLQHALLDIFLCTDRHTGENLVEWIQQVLHANDICVWILFLLCLLSPWLSFLLCWQRLDIGALTHDHGADISKAARLSGIHDFQCFDHELDLTIHAGLDCPSFAPIFLKASNLVSTIQSSNNLYRKLRDDQVRSLFLGSSWFCQTSSPSCLCSWSCG